MSHFLSVLLIPIRKTALVCYVVFAIATIGGPSIAASSEGVTQSEISIGQVADFSGPLAGNVKEGTEAVLAYFDKINKAGGVNGRRCAVFFIVRLHPKIGN